ncbi:MAG: cellulase family glycosylhydrolase [Pyrinomonadaceae bacterium]|nr:cellulase family glycosylhydrolase [Pyrinomonadaceae bacterium]
MAQLLASLCVGVLLFSSCASSAYTPGAWPSDTSASAIPEAVGVNIHFTNPDPGEVKMLAAAGFRWVRMDFVWKQTEVERGKYDFSTYDHLLKSLDEHHIRPLFILDYSNTLYDNDRAPYTAAGRRAFANWAAAAVQRYRGRGILWEIYNEPNTGFWTPQPKASDYIKLALEASKAIHQAAPGEQIIGPALWGMDFAFLEACLQSGLLNYWSAVSVHPYRKTYPETVVADYVRVRALIAKYVPAGKRVPIISSEWGYSSASVSIGEGTQAALLARQLLINQSQGIALSIWYDWQNDGENPREIEHHFGTVRPKYHAARDPIYDPKPAYHAVQTLTRMLHGYKFGERVPAGLDDYLLKFHSNGDVRYAVWTVSSGVRSATIPLGPGIYRIVSHTGEVAVLKTVNDSGLLLNLTNAPQYIALEKR